MPSFASSLLIAGSIFCCAVSPAWATGLFDGPAELPRVTVASSLVDTPAPGSVVTVKAGDNLQTALDNAQCGDTIELEAGATFTGVFILRAKSCDSGHWIVIRSSAPDSALPAEGQRLTPCYAGVASLPGRPAYSCLNAQNVMARIENDAVTDGPLVLRDGANHYRLIGLEITRTAGVQYASKLITGQIGGSYDHVVVDRCWFHGTLHDETQNGVSLNGGSNVAVVDSYFTDFHCTYPGMCQDAHAVGGGVGTHQDGPFKISNNFLEASGEAVMFGGGAATLTPTDIEIRRNHFFKPWQWMPGNPGFVGGAKGQPFVTKNHLEVKNAIRVLVEANLFENNWGGFSQAGYAILLGPKNQHTPHGNVCPRCQVTDVTIRYCHTAHSGSGISMATPISGSGKHGGQALAGMRWSIHDVVLDDISKNYVGGGNLFMIENGWSKNPVNTITINHVTGFPDAIGHLSLLANARTNPDMYGFVFTNNLVMTALYPVWSAGWGKASCAAVGTPAEKISKCFKTYTYKNNALIGTPDTFPPSSWPAGNFFPKDVNAAGIVDFNGGDYRLQPGSQYSKAGIDGKDLGADIVGLNAALAGVE